MKFNKKIIVPALSAVMGLSLVGGIAGTFAWYQYSTQATTSWLGTNVAETGVLEISANGTDFKRDLISAELMQNGRTHTDITPVTFGQIVNGDELPANAYKNPNAALNGKAVNPGSYANVYQAASAAEDYIQYTVHVRAREVGNVSGGLQQVEKDVYLTDIVLEDVGHKIENALRVHLAIDEDGDDTVEKNFLLARSAVNGLQLYGVLDCDDDDYADIVGGYEWKTNRNDIVFYGNEGEYQQAIAMDQLKASAPDGNINPHAAANIGKKLFTTPLTGAAKVTVTIWLEGWDNSTANFKKDVTVVTDEAIYVADESIKGEDLTGKGLFTKSGNVYTVAAGIADNTESYFAVSYEKVHLDKDDAIPADTYRATADATAAFVAAGTVDTIGGVDYYVVHDSDVTSSIRMPLADPSAAGYFIKNAGNYSPAPATPADSAETYYKQIAEPTETLQVAADTPDATVSVDGLYIRSGSMYNYVYTPASGLNENGKAYYSLDLEDTISNVPMWNGYQTADQEFHFGLTFDVGQDAFKA